MSEEYKGTWTADGGQALSIDERVCTLPPTNMEAQKGPFQEESSLSAGVCALPC